MEGVLELRQLRYFKVVADAGSFARAALKLRVAQPALSRSIANLEEDIGHLLFVRHSKGVSLTGAGLRCYEHTNKVLGTVRELVEGVVHEDSVAKGTITIGAPQSILSKVILPVVATFLDLFPQCRVDIIQNSSAQLREQVTAGKIDIAVLSNVDAESAVHLTPLFQESICLVCRRGDHECFGESIDPEELLHLPLVISGYPDSMRLYIDRKFPYRRETLNIRSEVNSSSMVVDLVSLGVGFGVAPYVGRQIEKEVDFIPINGLETYWTVGVAWDRAGLRAVQEMQRLLDAYVREKLASAEWPTARLG